MTKRGILREVVLDAANCILPPTFGPPDSGGHKYDRGHIAVISGPILATGASRLAAQAALAMGAGLVTIYGDTDELREHAAHVTAVMLAQSSEVLSSTSRRIDAYIVGPGHGGGAHTRSLVLELLRGGGPVMIDADGLTAFEHQPGELFEHCHGSAILTPHAGEFARLFANLEGLDRLTACRDAARLSGAIVVLKGAKTVVATPDERYAINRHASPWLATAGSGDVLAGMIGAILGQGANAFDAACAAIWMHGDIGVCHGPGLTAERIVDYIPETLARRLSKV